MHPPRLLQSCLPLAFAAVGMFTTSVSAQTPAYRALRYDEDYRYLRDPARATDAFDALKYIPLDEAGDRYLSIGGEVRERYEYFHDAQWGGGPQDRDGYLLQRYMLHADLHLGEPVRFFGQLKSGLESGRNGGPRPTDEDRFDVHQGFVDVQGSLGSGSTLTARLGRQELQYGSSRLVSVRESPNVRQSFDGARLLFAGGGWKVDLFLTRPVATERGTLDDRWDDSREFYGIYATGPLALLPDGHVDLYLLELDRQSATYHQGSAREHRRSAGTRLFGKPAPWDYNCEAVWQFGDFGDGTIEAWTVASDTGYTFPVATAPRFAIKADITSGDRNPGVDTLQTFHPLFPRGAYFGEPALIGPANLIDLHPTFEFAPVPEVQVFVDWDWFWRQTLTDGIYNVAMSPQRPGAQSDRHFVGSQVELGFTCKPERHVSLTAVYAHFFAGPYLEDTGAHEDLDYLSVWATFKF